MADFDYMVDFPHMPDTGWVSTPEFDLGLINGLFKVANKSINQLYGDIEFHLKDDDVTDLEDLNDFTSDGTGALVYASIWAAVALIFTLAGMIWCCCNKCACCCRSSFEGMEKDEMDKLENTDPRFDLSPRYSERKATKSGKPSTGAIVVAVLMAIWLLSLLLMIIHTFGANQKQNEAIDQINNDLENALTDIIAYLGKTIEQLSYTFGSSHAKFNESVQGHINACGSAPECAQIQRDVPPLLTSTGSDLATDLKELSDALEEVKDEATWARNDVDEDYEDVLTNVNNGLYWLFMLFNLIYVAIFILVLIGTVLAVFAKQTRHKRIGYLLMRAAIVFIFIMGIVIVTQMIVMFFAGGIISEVICPAIRELETTGSGSNTQDEATPGVEHGKLFQNGDYEVPSFGSIVRNCKAGRSAFTTFGLEQVFNVNDIEKINADFDAVLPGTGGTSGQIRNEVRTYTAFIRTALEGEIGRCHPAYNAMNTTISLFCYKIAAPMIGFWWILQFVAVVFLLIVITALVFERLHF